MSLILCSQSITFREALSGLLAEHGYVITAVAGTPDSASTLAVRHGADMCLLDCESLEGVPEAIAAMTGASIRVLALVDPSLSDDEERALQAVGAAWVPKSLGADGVLARLNAWKTGDDTPAHAPAEPRVATRLNPATPRPHTGKGRAAMLTPREEEVLEGLVLGDSTQDLAARLGVSSATARKHVERLLAKLGVHSRAAAVAYAIRHGLVEL